MRTAKINTIVPWGAELRLGSVEVAIQRGLPDVRWVGLSARAAQEHTIRVRAALISSGYTFPMGRVSIKVEPASMLRTGYDLPIALAILTAAEQLETFEYLAFGELSFSGELLLNSLATPLVGLATVHNMPWIGRVTQKITNLKQVVQAVQNKEWPVFKSESRPYKVPKIYKIDALLGNSAAKRVIALALAGRHHVLLSGPPGYGKSVLADAAAELIPGLSNGEENALSILESQRLQASERKTGQAPYRAPHHAVTIAGLLGGGNPFRPGELSLASYGALFLDELPLCSRGVTEALREPLETGELRWGGLQQNFRLPACPVLFAARNLCGCGKLGSDQPCTCTGHQRATYAGRITQPLLDRFPLHCDLDKRDEKEKHRLVGLEYAAAIKRVRARKDWPIWTKEARSLLDRAIKQYDLSYRAEAQLKAVSQTIASFDEHEKVEEVAVHEALQYRVRNS